MNGALRAAAALTALILLNVPLPVVAAGPLTIPVILSLTGQAAFLGAEEQQALAVLETNVNRTGGIDGRSLHFDITDDQSNPQVAAQLAASVLVAKPPIVLGPTLAASCRAVAPLFVNGPVEYCFSPAVHPPAGGYVFSASASTTDLIASLVRYAHGRGWTRLALLTSTDASGQDGDDAFLRAIALPENRGLALVGHERFNPSDLTIAAQMARIKSASPQVLLSWATGTPSALILHGYAEAGLDIPVALNTGNLTYAQMQQYATFMPREVIFPGVRFLSFETLSKGPLKDAQQAYYHGFDAIGVKPDFGQSLAWDPGLITVDALRHVPSPATPDRYRAYIVSMRSFVGINGLYNFSDGLQRGLTQNVCVIVRWDAGRHRWIPISEAGGKPLGKAIAASK